MSPKPAARPLHRKVIRILLWLIALYVLVLVAAFFLQRKLIYFPTRLEQPVRTSGPSGSQVVTLKAADGTGLYGLYVPPPDAQAPVALVLHGNAGNMLTWAPFLEPYVRQGLGALLLDPRGYGWSEGDPTEEGWHQDAEAALAWLAAHGSPAPRVIVVGVSIGSGPATALAARHPVRGLILQSAFTCLADAACSHYPFLPCRLLLKDRYDNLGLAPEVRCPVLLFHGTADVVVPTAHAQRLAAAFPARPVLHLAPGRGHNDVDDWSGYEPALHAFVAGLR